MKTATTALKEPLNPPFRFPPPPAKLRAPYRLRGTSPLRSKGRKQSVPNEDYPRPTASRPPYRSRLHSNIGGQDPAASWGVGKRPWTIGEFDSDSMENLAAFAKVGRGGSLRRVRSAQDSSRGLSSSDPRGDLEGSAGPGRVSKNNDDDNQFNRDDDEDDDDDDDDGDGCVGGGGAVSSAAPPQFVRRVSFADGGGDFFLEEIGNNNKRNNRRLSSLIDSGYPEHYDNGDNDTNSRRTSDVERQRHAMELVRAAHELMFTDTRPDGLRPITGSPMADGKGTGGSGGLYVGLAGLRGFDLSFLGAAPTQGVERRRPARLPFRTTASSPANKNDGVTRDCKNGAMEGDGKIGDDTPAPASAVDASWLEQGFLLGREPGSLMPTIPGEDNTADGDLAPIGSDDVGAEEGCGSLAPSCQDRTSAGVDKVRREGGGSLGGEEEEEEEEIEEEGEDTERHSHLHRKKRAEVAKERGVPGTREGTALSPAGVTAVSRATAPATTSTMGAPTAAAAALFFPQAAVLWSPANVSIDDLVLTVASRRHQQVSYFLFDRRNQ